MLLTGQKQFEISMFVLNCPELFLESCQPAGNQMQILKAKPLP